MHDYLLLYVVKTAGFALSRVGYGHVMTPGARIDQKHMNVMPYMFDDTKEPLFLLIEIGKAFAKQNFWGLTPENCTPTARRQELAGYNYLWEEYQERSTHTIRKHVEGHLYHRYGIP